jgi:transcriptional regulator with XRE-family HTH domain
MVIPMTPEQCRMARGALRWSIRDLSEKTGVHRSTINRFESDENVLHGNVLALEAAMRAAGVEFFEDDGRVCVRLKDG